MTDTEIKEFAIKKVEEFILEIKSLEEIVKIIQEMKTILAWKWFLRQKKKYEKEK